MASPRLRTRHPGIYKRGSRYVVRYRVNGRERSESTRTLEQALRLKRSREAARDRGELMEQSRVGLREYAEEWVERYQGRGRRGFRESTRDDYRRDLDRYVLPQLETRCRRVEQVSPRDVAALVGWLCDEKAQGRRAAIEKREALARKKGVPIQAIPLREEPIYLSDATVRRILSPLRACMASAVVEGLIRSNPTTGIPLPARDEQRSIDLGNDQEDEGAKALSTSELENFLRVCPDRWRLFFELLASTGLRISEAVALRWRDIPLDGSRPEVRVRRAHVRGRFGPPKSKYGRRTVPIGSSLVWELRSLRKSTEWPGDDDLVFPARNGEPLRQENVRRRVLKPTAEEAGVPWMAFHTLRHTCATRLFAGGRNAVQVQRWLGHHSPAFTLKVYVHLLDEDVGEALELSKPGGHIEATDPGETEPNQPDPLPTETAA